MKKMNPKVFWSSFLFLASVIGGLLFIITSLVISVIFFVSLVIGVVVFYPFLPHMPIVYDFFLRQYEYECAILRVLNMARFDMKRKFG